MKKETIKKAKELEVAMDKLNAHKGIISNALSHGGYESLKITPVNHNWDSRELFADILPVSLDNLIAMYMLNLDKRIAELEKELEQL